MKKKKKVTITLTIILSIAILFSLFKIVNRSNENSTNKDSINFLYGPWISEVKLPMSAELKSQFYKLGMGEYERFQYGSEQVELIFTKLSKGQGSVEGVYVKENTKYHPSQKIDTDGFREVKLTNSVNNFKSLESHSFRYKFINKNKIEMKMIISDISSKQDKNFSVYFIRENKR